MGYCMDQEDTRFRILAKNKHKAWEATRPLLHQPGLMRGFARTSCGTTRHFSWVDMEGFQQSKTIEGVLEAWRWEAEVDEKTGDVTGVCFRGEKLGDDSVLWRTIAPYVESGSYITMRGEDGAEWVWRFDDGHFE